MFVSHQQTLGLGVGVSHDGAQWETLSKNVRILWVVEVDVAVG